MEAQEAGSLVAGRGPASTLDSHLQYEGEPNRSSEATRSDWDGEDEESQPTSVIEEEQLTALEYARRNGLCVNYLSERPEHLLSLLPPPEDSSVDLQSPEGVFPLDLTNHCFLTERLEVGIDAAILLKSVVVPEEDPFLENLPTVLSHSSTVKLELPLLHTDHELDVLHFGGRAVPNFGEIALPLERCDDEKDEGMGWPTKYLDLPKKYADKFEMEKWEMDASSAATKFLLDVLRPSPIEDEMEELFAAQMTYARNPTLEPLTPPLLPLSPPLTPFEPSESAAGLKLLSDQTDPAIAEANVIDERLEEEDSLRPPDTNSHTTVSLNSTDELLDLYSPLRFVLNSSSPPSNHKRKLEELKVEVPLTPTTTTLPTKKLKSVSFPDMLHEYIPQSRENAEEKDGETSSLAGYEAFFDNVIEPIAQEADRAIEQEQLQEADSLLRVDVPVMDFSQPPPPWKLYALKINGKQPEGQTEAEAQQKLLEQLKQTGLCTFKRWSGIEKLNKLLNWTPFPVNLPNAAMNESIDDAEYLGVIMDDMSLKDVVVSDMLTWKPNGLRILDDINESEDELDPTEFEDDPVDIEGLMRKRRRDFAKEDEELNEELGLKSPRKKQLMAKQMPMRSRDGPKYRAQPTLMDSPDQGRISPPQKVQSGIPSAPRSIEVFLPSGTFSASNSLSNFMHKMGRVSIPPKTISPSITEQPAGQIGASNTMTSNTAARPEPTGETLADVSTKSSFAMPTPEIAQNSPVRSFIISTELLRNQRSLMRIIGHLYKKANYVERVFSEIPTAIEPDIILSPAAGLVLTNLQKIKQRALPGQEGKAVGVKDRLLDLSFRYERVILLVSEGATTVDDIPRMLDNNDSLALADLMGFASQLDSDTKVMYIAGGEDELARWIVSHMLKYCVQNEETQLLQDETLWEQLLRRAGLNAYAAQLILVNLKDPDPNKSAIDTLNSGANTQSLAPGKEFGLRAFMRMDPTERIRRYEGFMGGRRVLTRVNKVLSQKWLSAADGFKLLDR